MPVEHFKVAHVDSSHFISIKLSFNSSLGACRNSGPIDIVLKYKVFCVLHLFYDCAAVFQTAKMIFILLRAKCSQEGSRVLWVPSIVQNMLWYCLAEMSKPSLRKMMDNSICCYKTCMYHFVLTPYCFLYLIFAYISLLPHKYLLLNCKLIKKNNLLVQRKQCPWYLKTI